MTRRHLPDILSALILIAIANLTGCGSSTSQPGLTSPHGGTLVPLLDGNGFAEVLRQPASGKAGRSVLVVYFLDRDRNPVSPAPTAATFKGRTTGDKPVAFKPLEGADASQAGAIASEPIADRGEIEGELTATVGGSPVTVPILVR